MYDFAAKKILLTGGTGFIGGHLAHKLLGDGQPVRVLARTPAKADSLSRLGAGIIQGDLLDPASVNAAVQGCQVVVHCAGAINQFASWEHYRAIHVEATKTLAEAVLHAGVERLVFTSSIMVYGLGAVPGTDENSPHQLSNERYSDTKIEGERVLREYIEKGLPAIIIQPSQVYGPGDETWTIGPFRLIRRNLMTLPGGGRGIIHPIFIDDLVRGMLAVMAQGRLGETYILCGPEPTEVGRFFGYYAQMLGKKWIPSVPGPLALAGAALFEGIARLTGGKPVFTRDNVRFTTMQATYRGEKARRDLGFTAGTSLEEGMRLMESWFREEGMIV